MESDGIPTEFILGLINKKLIYYITTLVLFLQQKKDPCLSVPFSNLIQSCTLTDIRCEG